MVFSSIAGIYWPRGDASGGDQSTDHIIYLIYSKRSSIVTGAGLSPGLRFTPAPRWALLVVEAFLVSWRLSWFCGWRYGNLLHAGLVGCSSCLAG